MKPKTIYTYKDYGTKEKGTFVFNTSKGFLDELSERRIYCKNCGHTLIMTYKRNEDICSYCGYKVKKEGKLLFKDKMRVLLNEGGKDEKRN